MFERLSDNLSSVFRTLAGKATITESNVSEAMEDVRKALLDADVQLEVVNDFCAKVLEDAKGQRVTRSVAPGQEMVAIVHDRLVEFLGGTPRQAESDEEFKIGSSALTGLQKTDRGELIPRVAPGPTIVMMCGLQGSGKTTTCGKLAAYLKKQGRSVMLVAADLQRPAAVEQLHTVADSVQKSMPGGAQVHFYAEADKTAEYGKAVGVAVQVARRGVEQARAKGIDTVILDTAGRLHVNDALMDELQQVNKTLHPHQILLVVDAMTGQDAVRSAKAFHERLEVDGVILTKFDSDTRGGAAISVKHVTGAPIRFVGVGEKLEALEEFHPERVAGRILGMGDVVSLVEKAREQVTDEDAERLSEKLAKGEMTMEDFLGQLKTLRRMGPLKQLMGLIPGVGSALKDVHIDDKQLDRVEAIVNSMTKKERQKPSTIDLSRRKRIAAGSGTDVEEVGRLVSQFLQMNELTKQMASMSAMDKVNAVKKMGKSGMDKMLPGVSGMPQFRGKGTTHTESVKSKFKKRR